MRGRKARSARQPYETPPTQWRREIRHLGNLILAAVVFIALVTFAGAVIVGRLVSPVDARIDLVKISVSGSLDAPIVTYVSDEEPYGLPACRTIEINTTAQTDDERPPYRAGEDYRLASIALTEAEDSWTPRPGLILEPVNRGWRFRETMPGVFREGRVYVFDCSGPYRLRTTIHGSNKFSYRAGGWTEMPRDAAWVACARSTLSCLGHSVPGLDFLQ